MLSMLVDAAKEHRVERERRALLTVVQALPTPKPATSVRSYHRPGHRLAHYYDPTERRAVADAAAAARYRAEAARRWMGEELAPGVLRCPAASGEWKQGDS